MNENISSNPKERPATALSDLDDIPVAGITPFTTIDFPGRLAGVFYLQGCPWRCRYCYNSEFWLFPPSGHAVPAEKIKDFLLLRQNRLDGIVFSGGEPTAHSQLHRWMSAVKQLGFSIGLHTGGMYPERLQEVLPLCDWIGLDIKAPFLSYEKITQVPASGEGVKRSAQLIVQSSRSYEFRTTVHPDLLSDDEILRLAHEISAMGCKYYALQAFKADFCPDKTLRDSVGQGSSISAGLRTTLQGLFHSLEIRIG